MRISLLAALATAALALGPRRRGAALALGPRRRGGATPLLVRGGRIHQRHRQKAKPPPAEKPVARDFRYEAERTWIDRTIGFLEAPMTELVIGALAVALSAFDVAQQVAKFGVRDANWAVLFLASARALKAFLAVLRSTRMALKGYKSYAVVRRGENVLLKKLPATEDDMVDVS